jgi:Yip1-like protein
MSDSSSVGVLLNIFTAPTAAFGRLRERPNPWLALLILLVGYGAVSYLYLQVVDLAWMLDQQMAQAGNLTDEQRKQAVDAAMQVSPAVYGVIGAVGSPLFILIVVALVALYFTGVSFATNDGVKYGQWFAMTTWALMPIVIGLAATFINLLVSDSRFIPQEKLNPLAFGNLLGIDIAGLPRGQRGLLSLDISAIWAVVLLVLGHQVFTQRSIVRAAIVVLGPIVAIVLISVVLSAL